MVARVNGGIQDASQTLVGGLGHFTITFLNNSAGAVNLSAAAAHAVDGSLQRVLEAVAVKSTVVMQGDVTATYMRVAVENSTAWTAADLQAAVRALGATVGADAVDLRGTTVAAFTY